MNFGNVAMTCGCINLDNYKFDSCDINCDRMQKISLHFPHKYMIASYNLKTKWKVEEGNE